MYIPTLELHEAASFEDATTLLSKYSPDVRLLAGGTDVLVDLKNNGTGIGHLVTLSQIETMRGNQYLARRAFPLSSRYNVSSNISLVVSVTSPLHP